LFIRRERERERERERAGEEEGQRKVRGKEKRNIHLSCRRG
jgi:hypothetical protein